MELLELDTEHVISRGQVTLLEKQRLIDDCLGKSYEISLGCGLFGNCLNIHCSCMKTYVSEILCRMVQGCCNLDLLLLAYSQTIVAMLQTRESQVIDAKGSKEKIC
ncbi:unnamed protein product [Urochloa humidicola]